MKRSHLALGILGFLSLLTVAIFYVRIQPIYIPKPVDTLSTIGTIATPSVTYVNPSIGKPDAPITIVQFGDFSCDACRQTSLALEALQKFRPDTIRIVWKNLPNESLHPFALKAAMAAHCAARQKRFWEYHDALFSRQTILGDAIFSQIAAEIGIDTDAFGACFASEDTLPIIRKDVEEATALNIIATPTIFIGTERLVGETSLDELNAYVEKLIPKQ